MKLSEKSVVLLLYILAGIIVLYWVLWFAHRSLIASDTGPVYIGFENAFPFADGLLALGMVLTAHHIATKRPTAVLFGLMSAGGGIYLFAMDVLYDLEHRIWFKGFGGAIEALINVVTLTFSVVLARWVWSRRGELDPVAAKER